MYSLYTDIWTTMELHTSRIMNVAENAVRHALVNFVKNVASKLAYNHIVHKIP